jgi:ABC-type transport system involved in cytochrome c biogenesis permease subunit
MFRRSNALWILALLVAGAAPAVLVRAAELDWSTWREIPVLHDGRMQPLDTFARTAVEIMTGSTNPKLGLKDVVPDDELDSADLAQARELFPDGKVRKYTAAELLFSMTTEPEKWEDVPFLYAKHELLREKYLHVPLKNAKGDALKYVSPRQVQEALDFHNRLDELNDLRRQARQKNEKFDLVGVDKKLGDLQQAYSLYRQLTFQPARVMTLPALEETRGTSRFLEKLNVAYDQWSVIENVLQQLHDPSMRAMLCPPEKVDAIGQPAEKLYDMAKQPNMTLADVEPLTRQLSQGAAELAAHFGKLRERITQSAPPAEVNKAALENLQSMVRRLSSESVALAKVARQLHMSLYDNGDALRLVPALDPDALERNRETTDDANPWLNLQSLLVGSDAILAGYPPADIAHVREAFHGAGAAYAAFRADPNRENAAAFAADMQSFSDALRSVGEAVEPLRAKLPIADRDEDLIAYTAYPPAGSTHIEAAFNRLEPFMWSWVFSLAALACFALSFGVARRPMFWAGMFVVGVGLAWTICGFAMRIAITRWAPVTNMYETVIYVPTFALLLGVWFTMIPMVWPGLTAAWRWTAIPGTWEARKLTAREQDLLAPAAWTWGGFLSIFARAALMAFVFWLLALAPYSAGERTIINLAPQVARGESLPDGNGFLTWAVGWCVLAPTVWYLPRVIMTAALSLFFVPRALRGRMGELVEQVYPRWPFAFSATAVAFCFAYAAWWLPIPGKTIGPLQPVLRDNFWLTIHVLTIVSSYGAGLLAWMLGNIGLSFYLFGKYRDPPSGASARAGHSPAARFTAEAASKTARRMPRLPPKQCASLAGYVYKAVQVAVLLLITGTFLGGLWADVSWGRFWGWDPKEVWALISGLVYLAILHGRYAGWFGNFGLTVGSVLGASAIAMSWYGVNFVLGVGLHAYGFGQGGQMEVASIVAANWIFVAAATVRYHAECGRNPGGSETGELASEELGDTVSGEHQHEEVGV